MNKTLHLAKIIVSNNKEPFLNGALLTEGSKILQVGQRDDFGNIENMNASVIDHGDSLICPGFINLHTHLLYSKIKDLDCSGGLFPWLEQLIDKTSNYTEKDYTDSISYGIKEAISTGTTFIVDNSSNNLSAKVLSKSKIKSLLGIEVFGSDEEKAEEIYLNNINNLSLIEKTYPNISFTLSPHAPYDVSKSLWKYLIEWSAKNKKPLLTHLEESPQEKSWWNEKSGPGTIFWKKIDKLTPKLKYWRKYNSGIDFLEQNALLTEYIIATHLCQAKNEDLVGLKNHNIKLVHCPRSNYYLNNGTANLKLWSELNFLWGIGTDSLASNSNLDLLDEVRFAANQQSIIYNHSISDKEAFCSITSNAAKIISKDSEIGSLQEGCCGDFLIYDIKEKSGYTYHAPYRLLLWKLTNKKNLKEVWINSEIVWQRSELLNKI